MSTAPNLELVVSSLSLDSTLQELPLQNFQIESSCVGKEVIQIFEGNPLLPGVILTQDGQFFGMISRRRFLEHMSRPYGLDLFLKRALYALYDFAHINVFVFAGDKPIVEAAKQTLQRSPEFLHEPLVVQLAPQDYQLLSVHQLFIAQSHIQELATRLLQEQTRAQMIQTEKMASLGQMVAGVAHEINNPVNFISGNLGYLSNYSQDLFELLAAYQAELPQPSKKIETLVKDIELEFLLEDMPQVIDSMKLGAERLKKIVGGLRNFSHMDEANRRPIDLHECIDSTLLILNNRLKAGIEIIKDYGDLPEVGCYSGQLSQVFMNILSNAIDALMEQVEVRKASGSGSSTSPWQPEIKVITELCVPELPIDANQEIKPDRWVSIRIVDNGPGIPEDIQDRIFETFFTTKPVGKGTGLGLAISYQIVTEKHNGKLNLHSQLGEGTEFQILLPLV